jgi:hypothetical protein
MRDIAHFFFDLGSHHRPELILGNTTRFPRVRLSLPLLDDIDRDLHRLNRSSVLEPVGGVPILGPAHWIDQILEDRIQNRLHGLKTFLKSNPRRYLPRTSKHWPELIPAFIRPAPSEGGLLTRSGLLSVVHYSAIL